jgi:hypothetical protein
MDWIENGPVSLPPRTVVTIAAALVFVAAAAGAGLGFHAVWRGTGPSLPGDVDQADISQAVAARPIVELTPTAPPPPPAEAAANTAKEEDADADDTNEIAAKTAAVQAAQSRTAETPANIDQLLTSSSEKPQAPVKPAQDEDSAAKSDVPF